VHGSVFYNIFSKYHWHSSQGIAMSYNSVELLQENGKTLVFPGRVDKQKSTCQPFKMINLAIPQIQQNSKRWSPITTRPYLLEGIGRCIYQRFMYSKIVHFTFYINAPQQEAFCQVTVLISISIAKDSSHKRRGEGG
jgi:hypothetical protein